MLRIQPQIGQSYHVEVEPPDGPLVIFDATLTDFDKVDEDDTVYQSMSFGNGVTVYTGGSPHVHLIDAERWAVMELAQAGGSDCRVDGLSTEAWIAFPSDDCRN